MNEAATLIQEEADDDANIIFGAVIDESMGDEMRITVIATGFGERVEKGMGRHGSELRGVQAGGRPVRRHGLVADDELDVPTWQRRRKDAPVSEGRQAAAPSPPAPEEGDEFEIPTFLRRGAE